MRDIKITVFYPSEDGATGDFACRLPWCITVRRTEAGETNVTSLCNNTILGAVAADIHLDTDVFAIRGGVLFIMEESPGKHCEELYIRVLSPLGSTFDLRRVNALISIGVNSTDAIRIVATT